MKKLIIILLSLSILTSCLVSCSHDDNEAGSVDISGEESANVSVESLSAASVAEETSAEQTESDQAISQDESTVSSETSAEEDDSSDAESAEETSEPIASEQTSEAETSKTLLEMTASELLDYAYLKNASLDNYTANTSNKMEFTYAGQTSSFSYTAVTKAEGFTDKSYRFTSNTTANFDETSTITSEACTDGYYYCDDGTDKLKAKVTSSQAGNKLSDIIGTAGKMDGDGFKTLQKAKGVDNGWVLTGTGVGNNGMNEILGELFSMMDLGVTTSDIKLNTFTAVINIDSEGYITGQNVGMTFSLDYSGVSINFTISMSVKYSDFGTTNVKVTLDPGDYTEKSASDLLG